MATHHDRLDDKLRAILEHASLAPSGHNAQPWEVRVLSARRFLVESVRERWLPAVDPANREVLLSLGAFVESAVIAAGAMSLAATVHVVATSPKDLIVADVALEDAPPSGYPLDRLRSRRVLRTKLATAPLDPHHVAMLTEAAGALRYVPRGDPTCAYLDEVTIDANRRQAFRDAAQRELCAWVRWTKAEARARRDGLSLEALEVKGLTGWVAQTFLDKELLLSPGSRAKTVDLTRSLVAHSGGWLVIASEDDRVPSIIDAGRRFQRMALLVRSMGIALHPMSQALEEEPLCREVPARLGIGVPQLLLRVGRCAAYPEPVSLRRPVDSFVHLV
jgi:nitroreductase